MGACPCSQKRDAPALREDVVAADDHPGVATVKLTVMIHGARGVRRGDWFPGSRADCFCVLGLLGREETIHRTRDGQEDRVEPLWNEEVEIPDFPVGEALDFRIWGSLGEDAKVPEGSSNRMVGRAILPYSAFEAYGFNGELPLENLGKSISAAYLQVKVKAEYQEYPDGPDPEFAVTLSRDPKASVGIDFDTQDDELVYIADVKPGPIQFYNLNVKASEQVKPGLFIVQANGVKGVSVNIVEVLKGDRKLELVLRRSTEMTVAIRKLSKKSPLGMEFLPKASGNNLMIVDIADGPIFEWNLSNPELEVRCGDRVTAVNGVRGRAGDLLKRMKALERFQMTVVRPVQLLGR